MSMGLNFPVSPFSNGQRSVTHREVGPPNLLQISAKYDTFLGAQAKRGASNSLILQEEEEEGG